MRGYLLAPLVTWLAALTGCGDAGPDTTRTSVVRVVTSVLPHADIVRRIGGEHVHVDVLVPPGAAPHTYEPTVRELRAMGDADLYVAVGHPSFPFERAWFDRLIAERPDIAVINGADGAPALTGDPHVWFSLPAVRRCATEVHDALVAREPETRQELDANLARFLGEVDRVHTALSDVTRGKEGRPFFVFHPAWGYIADAYGLTQVAIEADGKEPSAAHVGYVIDRARAAHASVVFVQPQHATQGARVIADEIGAHLVTLDPLPADWVAGMDALVVALDEALSS